MKKPPTKFSISEYATFFRQLSFLMQASLPLSECISICATKLSKRKSAALIKISAHVASGQTFSESLKTYISNLPAHAGLLIQAGEESGILAETVLKTADIIQKQVAIKQKVISALIYPACIACVALLLIGFLTIGIFPRIEPLFMSMKISLPLPTQIMIVASDTISHNWFFIIGEICGFWIVMHFMRKIKITKTITEKVYFRMPIIGQLIKNYWIGAFSRTIAVATTAGIPLSHTLNFSTQSNTYNKVFAEAKKDIEQGKPLGRSFERYPSLFPGLFVRLVNTAELGGSLPETFQYLADYFERELDHGLKMLTSIIEPVLTVGLGISVGFVALAMILPIYEISQTVSSWH